MTLELIIFIAALLFGALLYWRESHSNRLYRFFNKLFNAKALQMKPTDKKGFLYLQSFFFRLIFITAFYLVGILIVRFLIPIDLATISIFASMIAGTILGTYFAGVIFKSSELIETQSDSLEDAVKETLEKGKDFIEDLKTKDNTAEVEQPKDTTEVKSTSTEKEKSARERLKDKGLL